MRFRLQWNLPSAHINWAFGWHVLYTGSARSVKISMVCLKGIQCGAFITRSIFPESSQQKPSSCHVRASKILGVFEFKVRCHCSAVLCIITCYIGSRYNGSDAILVIRMEGLFLFFVIMEPAGIWLCQRKDCVCWYLISFINSLIYPLHLKGHWTNNNL